MSQLTQLLKGIKLYGFNASKIKKNFFPKTPLQQIENRLETINPNRIKGKFKAVEDLEILSLLLFKSKTWKQLGIETKRGHMALRSHYTKNIQPNITKHAFENKTTFHKSLKSIYNQIKDLTTKNPNSESILLNIPQKWSNNDDLLLLRLVKKMGLTPRLLIEDFPGKNNHQILQRYKKLNPLNRTNSKSLTNLQFLNLKHGVEKYGRHYFAVLDLNSFPGWKLIEIVKLWALIEPVGLTNAVWNRQTDVQLVRKTLKYGKFLNEGEFSLFYGKEMETRFYLLSTSSLSELKNRYLIGKDFSIKPA